MDYIEILKIISSSILNVCILGTAAAIFIFLLALISKSKLLKKTTVLLSSILIFMWIVEVVCTAVVLFV